VEFLTLNVALADAMHLLFAMHLLSPTARERGKPTIKVFVHKNRTVCELAKYCSAIFGCFLLLRPKAKNDGRWLRVACQ
jgi:hypothetical protein